MAYPSPIPYGSIPYGSEITSSVTVRSIQPYLTSDAQPQTPGLGTLRTTPTQLWPSSFSIPSSSATISSAIISSKSTFSTSISSAPTSSPSTLPAPPGPKLSSGAIAGIAIGIVLAIAIGIATWWFCSRYRRKIREGSQEQTPMNTQDLHEKQVVSTSISDFPTKPELQGSGYVPGSDGSQQSFPQQGPYKYPFILAEQSSDLRVDQHATVLPAPLYDSAAKLDVADESVATLEEEERRIDAEMAEARRMQELRDRKYAVQQKLKVAKRKGPFEM